MLCSKSYGKASSQLCDAIAELSKILATQEVEPACLQEFVASRLIPLDKGIDSSGSIGIRPVGVGELLRRIIGKCSVNVYS